METTFESHFRCIIEQQPVCLIRVDKDGTFLAVNEAAMSLFGATRLDELLDRSILSLVVQEERADCREFIERVATGGRGTIELDVDALTGARHAVQISAVALPGSPDGIPSAYCTARDISKQRTLERVLLASAARQETQAAALRTIQHQFEQAVADQSAQIATLERRAQQSEVRVQALEAQLENDRLSHEAALECARQDSESRQTALEQALAGAAAREQAAASKLAEQDVLLREALTAAETVRSELAAREAGEAARHAELEAAWRGAKMGHLVSSVAAELEPVLLRATEHGRSTLANLPHASRPYQQVEQLLVATLHANSLLHRIRRESLTSAGTHAAAVLQRLTPQLEALLSPDISFRAHIQPSEMRVEPSAEQLEVLMTMLGASARSLMVAGGTVVLEVTDVCLDEACALERATSPGTFLLIALHAAGPGVDAGLPEALFSKLADETPWRSIGPGAVAALQLVRSAGGLGSVTRQGLDAITLELYLPCLAHASMEMTR